MSYVKYFTSHVLLFVLASTLVVAGFFNIALAQPAYTINYQGKLTTPTGSAVTDGTYAITFRLYTAPTGGSAIWTEARTSGNEVTLDSGLFSVMLGSITSLTSVNFNQPLYLGVTVEADSEMTPRKAIGSVPSAFEARQLGGVASSSFLRSDQADVAGSLLTFNGGLISNSSSTLARLSFTNATGTSLFIGGDRITDFVGDGLQLSGGTLQAALGSSVAANEIANGDHGFFSYASGVASLDTGGLTSANLLDALTNETGTGNVVFSAGPTFTGTLNGSNAEFTGDIEIVQDFSVGSASSIPEANVFRVDGNSALQTTDSAFIFNGASGLTGGATLNNKNAYTITSGYNSALFTLAQGATVTEAGSGNHPLIGTLFLKPPTITSAGATVTNTATLYIEGAPSATVSGANMALWVDSGNAVFDGNVRIAGTLQDSSGDAGTNGQVLLSTLTGTNWVATSSLGISAGGSLFTDGGANTYLTATGDNLSVGGTGGSARLNVYGNIDIASNNSALSFMGTRFLYASTTNDSVVFGENAGATFNANTLYNVAIGYEAGRYASTTGSDNNIFIGLSAGYTNIGSNNNFIGDNAGAYNTGDLNILIGSSAGYENSGLSNNIVGSTAGYENSGDSNNFFGENAGYSNTGDKNNSIGLNAGFSNSGIRNNFLGEGAGYSNAGDNNNFFGYYAGTENTGSYNEFIGYLTGLNLNATATVAIGGEALSGTASYTAINNVALGYRAGYVAATGANNNILIGYQAADNLTTGNNNIIIGYDIDNITATADNRLNIGNLIFGTGLDGTGTTLASGNVGIGTSSPASKLSVAGDLRVTGAFRDSSGDAGTNGQVLLSTVTGTNWTSTSSLGISGVSTASIEDLADVAAMTKNYGDLLGWNGSAWTDFATSSLNIALSNTTGTLGVTRGGTGLTTVSTGDLLYASASDTLTRRAIGTTGQVLQVVGGLPTWVATSSLGISGGGGGTYLSLTDTPGSYNTYRIPYTNSGASALVDASDFLFNDSTDRLTVGTATFGTTGMSFAGAATTTLANNNPYAFTFATSTTARPLFRIDTTTGGETVSIGTVGGDVFIGGVGSASDLIFEESSTISGQGTNVITLGVTGDIFNVASGVKFGVATSSPWQEFSVNGDFALTGRFYDSLASAGTNGRILQTTGTGVQWVATSSLGLATYAGFDTSSELDAVVTDNTGSGALVFATSPTLVTPNLGTPSTLTLTNATGLPIGGITGLGTGAGTALAVNVGTAGSFITNGGALGTPSSGTLTNVTGLPIVGGTTGTLTETRGGTNQTTYATGDLLYASGANTLAKRTIGSSGTILMVSAGVPTWAATSTLNLGANALAIDSLDFAQFQDTLDLDANTTINADDNTSQFSLNMVSDLSVAARTTGVLNITQANNVTNAFSSPTVGLLNISNSDANSTSPLLTLDQDSTSGSAASILLASIDSRGIYFGTSLVTGDTGISMLGVTETAIGMDMSVPTLTSGTGIQMSGSGVGDFGGQNFTGDYLKINPTRTHNGATSVTDSGNFLDIVRTGNNNNAGGTYNMTGDLAVFSSTLNESAGNAFDTSNVLSISQNCGANATCSGSVLELNNAGTGNGADFFLNNTAGTQTNGLYVRRNATGGTTTNGLQIASELGTLTTGLLIADGVSGTIGTGIQLTGTFSTALFDSPSLDITAAGAITGATGFNGLVVTANTGVVTTGTWQAGVIADTYINDSLTIGAGSTFANNIITPNAIFTTGQTDEFCLTYEGTGTTFEWQTCGGGMAIGGSITSATQGSVLFAGASGVLQQDNTNLFWDTTTATLRIGSIGTSNSALTLYKNSSTGGVSDAALVVRQDGTDALARFQGPGGGNVLTILSGGNVGIGTTTPGSRLTVNGNIQVSGTPSFVAGSMYLNGTNGLTLAGKTGATYDFLMTNNGGQTVFANQTGTTNAYFAGNVGIGTVSPDNRLEVEGASLTSFTGTNVGQLAVAGDAYTIDDIVALDFKPNDQGADAMARIGTRMTTSGSYLQFGTSNNYGAGITNNALIIDPNGNVGIGVAAPNAKLTLSNNVATNFLDAYSEYQLVAFDGGTAATSYGIGVKTSTLVFNSGAGAYSFDRGGSATSMVIDTAGNVGIGDTTPASMFTVGSGDLFQVNSSGAIAASVGITTTGNVTLSGSAANIALGSNYLSGDGGDEGIQINADGKLGFGIAPNSTDTVLVNGLSTYSQIRLTNSGTGITTSDGFALANLSTGWAYLTNVENAPLTFGTNNLDRMIILGNGDVGIGDTTPDAKLDIEVTSAGSEVIALALQNNSGTANTAVTIDLDPTGSSVGQRSAQISAITGGSNNTSLLFRTANGNLPVEHMRITATGDIGIGDTTPDARLDFDLTSTNATAATEYGSYFTVSDTGVVTTGTDTTYGNRTSVTRSGATGGSLTNYGQSLDLNGSFASGSGTVFNYGQNINVTGSAVGTSFNYGSYVVASGADQNIAFYGAVSGSGSTGNSLDLYGGYVDDSQTTANTVRGIGITVQDTGVVTTGGDNTFGSDITVTRSGATGGNLNNYGADISVTGTFASGAGNINNFGANINIVGNTTGNSTNYGLFVDVSGADNNYAAVFNTGNVGIGDFSPDYRLDIETDVASSYVASFFNDGNVDNRYGVRVQAGADDGSGTTYYLNALDGDGGIVGYLANIAGTFAVTDVSDIRTKTNVTNTEIVDATAVIQGLRVVDFNRIQDSNGPRITGFIAQEVQALYPYAVTEGPNGMLGLMKDAFIPLLVKGSQEQQSTITQQGGLLATLGASLLDTIQSVGDLQAAVTSGLSENYRTEDNSIEAGEIVALDTDESATIKRAEAGDRIFGVIATTPGLVLGQSVSDTKPIALSGRVPVKINLEGGDINVGDAITLSSQAGIGTKATTTGRILGTALEATDSDGTIEIFVDPGTYFGPQAEASLASLFTPIEEDENDTLWTRITTLASNFVDGVLSVAGVKTDKVEVTEELCVDGTCINGDDLRALLEEVGRSNSGSSTPEPQPENNGGGETPPPAEEPVPEPEPPQPEPEVTGPVDPNQTTP